MTNSLARTLKIVTLGLAIAIFSTSAFAGPGDEYKRMPGYVDFERMNVFDRLESTVDVFLKGALIKMAGAALHHDEPEIAEMLEGIKLVRVNVFDLSDFDGEFRAKTKKVAAELDKRGWEMVVRVREDEEQVFVYLLPSKNSEDSIDGLVVMAVEDGDEAVFVNIVGTISPEHIGKLGASFNIDELEDLHIEGKRHRRDRSNRNRDRDRDNDDN